MGQGLKQDLSGQVFGGTGQELGTVLLSPFAQPTANTAPPLRATADFQAPFLDPLPIPSAPIHLLNRSLGPKYHHPTFFLGPFLSQTPRILNPEYLPPYQNLHPEVSPNLLVNPTPAPHSGMEGHFHSPRLLTCPPTRLEPSGEPGGVRGMSGRRAGADQGSRGGSLRHREGSQRRCPAKRQK